MTTMKTSRHEILKAKWTEIVKRHTGSELSVTGQTQFVEVRSSVETSQFSHGGIYAVLRSNRNEIEVLNGADPGTLETILKILGRA